MCGISGLFFQNGKGEVVADHIGLIEKTLDTLHPRGPDEQGLCHDHRWVVGHTRLAIMDPEAGRQPFRHRTSGCIIVYNGEIYNYREIREALIARHYNFETDCDTEVALAAYLEWGVGCLERFNGCYAFAIVDPREQSILLARDRLGIKPLYFSETDNLVCFASTIPALLTLCRSECRINLPVLSQYLTTGRTFMHDETLLSGIRQLPSGTWRRYYLAEKKVEQKTYWRIPVVPIGEKNGRTFIDAVDECRDLLDDAVKLRLQSDVPLGVFMSGGLDSAIIADIASRHASKQFPLFCAGSDDDSQNEFKYAEIMSTSLGLQLTRKRITAETFSRNWRHLIRNKGLPLSTPNEISIYKLAQELKKSCSVVLTGEGADEVFGGYVQPHFSAFDFDRCPRDPGDVNPDSPFTWAMKSSYGRAWFLNDTDHYLSTGSWLTMVDKYRLFNSDTWNELDDDAAVTSFYEDFFNRLDGCSSFDKRLHLHANFNLENLLSRVDSSTMAASVEARVPFNDHRLVEFAFRLPDDFKMDWRHEKARNEGQMLSVDMIDCRNLLETKRVPRSAFRSRLPAPIIERKKMSFPVPFNQWFSSSLSDSLHELCLESAFTETYLQKSQVQSMLDRGDRNLWLIANLCVWWDEIRKHKITQTSPNSS